jgi:hypothetical protein
MSKYNFLQKPTLGIDFAVFPAIPHPQGEFLRAAVRLQVGDRRWGAQHIQLRHANELRKLKMNVSEFIASIVKSGSPIFCEFEGIGDRQRPQTVNVRIGTVVLEYRQTAQGNFYTVVTAFSRTTAIGELIGKLE